MSIRNDAAIEVLQKFHDEETSREIVAAMIVKSALADIAESDEERKRRGEKKTVGDVTSAGVTEYSPKDQKPSSVGETPEQQAKRGKERYTPDAAADPSPYRVYQTGETPADRETVSKSRNAGGHSITKEGADAIASWADVASDIIELGMKLPDLMLSESERKLLEEAHKFFESKVDEVAQGAGKRKKDEERLKKEEEKALSDAERLYAIYRRGPVAGTVELKEEEADRKDIWEEAVGHFERTWGKGKEGFESCVKDLKNKPDIKDPDRLCAWLHKKATGKMPVEISGRKKEGAY